MQKRREFKLIRKKDAMGARKTGRKKKSEYKRYKKSLKGLLAMEKGLAIMRNVTGVAMEIAKLQSISHTPRNFASGGVVSGGKQVEMMCNSGEMVIPISIEERRAQISDINIFPDNGDYHCIKPC